MVCAVVAAPAGATAGVAGGLAGAWRTSVCAVAQVATQCSWFLGWAWIRPSVPSWANTDRKSTRLNSSHLVISYAVFCLKKKKKCRAFLDASGGGQAQSRAQVPTVCI